MTQLHDTKVEISQASVVSHLKGDDNPPAPDYDQNSKSSIVKVFERPPQAPTLAKLLNPEIVVHKSNVAAGTACNDQATLDDEAKPRNDVGDGAARDSLIPPEKPLPLISQKRENMQQNQTLPFLHETFQLGDGLQDHQDDSEGDSAHKFKKPKLKHINYTPPLLSLSPTPSSELMLIDGDLGQKMETKESSQQNQTLPSPHATVKAMEIGDGLQVHPDASIDYSAPKFKKPKSKHFNHTPLPSSLSSTPLPEPHAPIKNKKRPKVKWTTHEEKLLKQGIEEGLGWQAISKKYLPHRDRSGCFLHWNAMKVKSQPPRRNWTPEENERLAKAIKARSKDVKEIWAKIAKDMKNERTWKDVEMQQAVLIVEKEKGKKKST